MPYQNPYMPQMGQYGYGPTYQAIQQQQQQQPVHGFVYVTGLEGARAYQMPPNSEMPLFDSTGDVLYIKTTDGAGFPTITIADCRKRDVQSGGVSASEYVTKEELERTYRDLASQVEQMKGYINGIVSHTSEPSDGPAAKDQADGSGQPAGVLQPAHAK